MGLFNFKKRPPKQEQSPDTIAQVCSVDNALTLSLPLTKNFNPVLSDSSLMEDIMNELDLSKSSVVADSLSSPKKAEPSSPDFKVPINAMAVSTSVPDMAYSVDTSSSGSSSSSNVVDSSDDSSDEEDASMIRRSVTFQNISANRTLSPSIKAPKKAGISVDQKSFQKGVMDRMKERHRFEKRQTIKPSINFSHYYPLPPVPGRMSPYDLQHQIQQRPIPQSQTFTALRYPDRGDGNQIRNTISPSDNDAERELNAARRNMSGSPLYPSHGINRHSYLPAMVPIENPTQFQFKRSISAYPSSHQDVFQEAVGSQQQQLYMYQLQHQRLQQQIEFQQHQLQEQQIIQQQQLQQLREQQQLINQSMLETTKRVCHYGLVKKPLYERCTTKPCHRCAEHTKHKQCRKQHCQEEIQVPDKLRRELVEMRSCKSVYSLPDITQFNKEQQEHENDDDWRTIKRSEWSRSGDDVF